MVEYICNTDDKCGCCDAYEQAERIVRCKDCKHFDQSTSLFRLNGKCLSERFFACKVKPNGFCAWGEPKEE